MQVLTLEKNRGYLIAGIGAIIALLAFAFMPHVAISSTTSGQSLTYTVSSMAQFQISVWIEGLMAVTAIAIAALIAFRQNPFSFLKSSSPLDVQIRYASYFLVGAGILGILTQLIITFSLSGQVQQGIALNTTTSTFIVGSDASVSFASGSWLYLLGMLAVIVGGFLASRSLQKNGYQSSIAGAYLPPSAQQPWMVNPYEAQTPQQQWNTGQSVPPAYQQWNTGQPLPPTQVQQPDTGQPLPPTQMQPGNTGQPLPPYAWQPPTPRQQWNTGQQMPPPWNPGQPPPPGSLYE